MKFNITNNVTRAIHKVGFQLKKHSPEILVVAGVVGTVASTVMACKATTKIDFVLEDTKKKIDYIHEGVKKGEVQGRLEDGTIGAVTYSEQDGKKDLAYVYAKTGLEIAKLYAPAVILGTLSITGIVASHRILTKRNVALTAAFATIDKSFKEYRGRVIDRFGKELDRELKYNIKTKEIEETVVNEDGSQSTVTTFVDVVEDPNGYSQYARFYDDGCIGWEKDAEHNLYFLKCQQSYANQVLQSKGYLFLNDVYKMLGIPETKAGQIVGWVYDKNNAIGDNYVDFGIFDGSRKTVRNFVNGHERTILLDFNVDGNIWELMS